MRRLIIPLLLCTFAGVSTPVPAAPAAEAFQPFSFVVWGHPRGPLDGEPPLHFDDVLEKIRKLQPNALIVTGDVVNGGSSTYDVYKPELIKGDWQRFKDATDQLGIPVLVSPGNHDANNRDTREMFLAFHREPPYAVTFNNMRFLILDTVGLRQRYEQAVRCPLRDKQYWPVVDGKPVESRISCWGTAGTQFDDAQVAFIAEQIKAHQQADHIFLFMHHTHPWAREDGWWWQHVHPLLKGTNTRAVFSGDPYNRKYGHLKEDGIQYMQSASFEGVPARYFANNRDKKAVWNSYHQLDTILHVSVDGPAAEDVEIQPVIIGALQSDAGNWRYWREVPKTYKWSQQLPEVFYQHFYRLRSLLLLGAVYGLVFFVLGVLITLIYKRRNT